ncbi:MAG: FAD-binding oxidoreductase [Pseudomonadota bacterium]
MSVLQTVQSNTALPSHADVVVVGGGIAGICAAFEMAQKGLRVVVCEKGVVAGEQSGLNWGWCRKMGRDPRELPLVQVSLDLWRKMRQRTGEETGFRECGIAYLCETEAQLAKRQNWFNQYVSLHGLSSRMISGQEAARLSPGATVDWKGGLLTSDDGRAEPTLAVPAIARAAQRAGVEIFQNCAVRGFETKAGRIGGVVTEQGAVECEAVLVAGGAWSRRFLGNMGIEFPQLSVVNSVMRTTPIETGITHSLAARKFAIRKRFDGGYTLAHSIYNTADITPDSFRLLTEFLPVLKDEWRDFRFRFGKRFFAEAELKRHWRLDETSPFEQVRQLTAMPNVAIQKEALTSVRATLPQFKEVSIAESWAGVIDVMPDAVPVIGPVDAVPGLFLSTGYSGHGFGLGPGAGQLAAELVNGDTPCVDPSPFRLGRFH